MGLILRRSAAVAVTAALILGGITGAGVTRQGAANASSASAGANANWPAFGNSTDNTRYSTLNQINTSNVSKLGVAWTQQEGSNLVTFETVPLVVNGVMYYTTNTDQVRAVNAATGKTLWQYTPKVDFFHSVAGGGGGVPTNRGVSVANGRVFLTTFDARLVALQASTGEVIWNVSVASNIQGYGESSPATYWNGMLFVGSQEGDAGMRGFVAAYNATSGKQIWRWFTVPAPGQGWVPKQGNHGGGDVWMPSVIDPTTGTLYVGTGNPSPDFNAAIRPGCNPWANAVVALNATSGKFKWGHTEFCNDSWDYDSANSPILYNATVNGKTVRVLSHANKSGKVFFYDASNGKVLATSPYLACWSMPHLKPSAKGSLVCPGTTGGIEYSPASYSPVTHALYQPLVNEAETYTVNTVASTNAHRLGEVDTGGSSSPSGPVTGAMAAISATTGKIMWKVPMSKPMVGGALATAGNVVFSGADDGRLRAFDAKTGKVLWQGNFGLSFGAAPIAYQVNGTEYIAIAVGGWASGARSLIPLGGTMVVLKLGGSPVHTLPAASGSSGMVPSVKPPSLAGFTKLRSDLFADQVHHQVVIMLTAAATTANNGFNFNGFFNGSGTFTVPETWTVFWEFRNKASLPHSAAIVTSIKTPLTDVPFGFGVASTPNAIAGTGAGVTQVVSFVADHPGKFILGCLVPGHIQSGMWDNFVISSTAKAPSITGTP
ncbi:MAG: putative pyrrolo-quinoline quinone [Chloroflexi bacterium]|nr:putative pyrrolo-quinoline quinone [Chloroflexota bacterium]